MTNDAELAPESTKSSAIARKLAPSDCRQGFRSSNLRAYRDVAAAENVPETKNAVSDGVTAQIARVAELADALDLGSSVLWTWGFESPLSHF